MGLACGQVGCFSHFHFSVAIQHHFIDSSSSGLEHKEWIASLEFPGLFLFKYLVPKMGEVTSV